MSNSECNSEYNLKDLSETLRTVDQKIDLLFKFFDLKIMRCDSEQYHNFNSLNFYGLECPFCDGRYDRGWILKKLEETK